MIKKIDAQKGVHIDINQSQMVALVLMFALFFLAPIFGVQYYNSTKNTPKTIETYTTRVLVIDKSVSALELNEPSVAGVSTSSPLTQFKIPYINLTVTNDFKNPTNLLIVIGLFVTIVSIFVLLANSLDLFKSSIYK